MFRVGMKVACIDNPSRILKKNDVYTVQQIFSLDGKTGLCFVESNYPKPFDAAYFRPAVERPTSISFAHEILRKATKRMNA